jgi:cytochrome b561
MLQTDEPPELRVYNPAIRILHWVTVFLVATIFILAFSTDFARSKADVVALTQLHRSFGVTVWAVTVGRLLWRQFSRFPNWPSGMTPAMRFAAQWSEYALYSLLLTQPMLGLLHTNADGDRVKLFFIVQLPVLIHQNDPLSKQLHEVHSTVGLFLLGLIARHASAALYRHFWRRDDTLTAMLRRARMFRDRTPLCSTAEASGGADLPSRPRATEMSRSQLDRRGITAVLKIFLSSTHRGKNL